MTTTYVLAQRPQQFSIQRPTILMKFQFHSTRFLLPHKSTVTLTISFKEEITAPIQKKLYVNKVITTTPSPLKPTASSPLHQVKIYSRQQTLLISTQPCRYSSHTQERAIFFYVNIFPQILKKNWRPFRSDQHKSSNEPQTYLFEDLHKISNKRHS